MITSQADAGPQHPSLSKTESLRSQASSSSLTSSVGQSSRHKLFSPEDFKRTRSNISIPPKSRNTRVLGSPDIKPVTHSPAIDQSPIRLASSLELTHDTFGNSIGRSISHSISPQTSPQLDAANVPSFYNESREDLISLYSESIEEDQDSASPSSLEATLLATPTVSRQESDSSCSLKEEAAQEWARYELRRTMLLKSPTPKIVSDSLFNNSPTVGAGISSPLPRSSLVLSALPKEGTIRCASSLALYLACKGTPPLLNESCSSSIVTEEKQSSFCGGGLGFISGAEPGLGLHYPASVISATTASMSPTTTHISLDSGTAPLLRSTDLHEEEGMAATSKITSDHSVQHLSRPATTNHLTAEERRRQLRRTKKLAQVLGEEMLHIETSKLFSNSQGSGVQNASSHTVELEAFKQRIGRNGARDSSRIELNNLTHIRPSSAVSYSDSLNSTASTSSQDPTSTSRPGRWRVRRRDKSDSFDQTLSLRRKSSQFPSVKGSSTIATLQPSSGSGPASSILSPKAASILGITCPQLDHKSSSKSASVTEPDDETTYSSTEHSEHITKSWYLPLKHLEPNSSTNLTALERSKSGMANDPKDVHYNHLEASAPNTTQPSLKQLREERRKKIAKMTRWLGEAVPVELIAPEATYSDSHKSKDVDGKDQQSAGQNVYSKPPKTNRSQRRQDLLEGSNELDSFHSQWDESSFSAPESTEVRRSATFEHLHRTHRASLQSRRSSHRPGSIPADSDKSSSFFDPSTPALRAWQRKRSCSLHSIDTLVYSNPSTVSRGRTVQGGVSFMSIDSSDSEEESPRPQQRTCLNSTLPEEDGESQQATSTNASSNDNLEKAAASSSSGRFNLEDNSSSDPPMLSSVDNVCQDSSSSSRGDSVTQPLKAFLYLDSDTDDEEEDADDERSGHAGESGVLLACSSDLSFDLDRGKIQPSLAQLEESKRRNRKLTRFFGLPPPPPALPAPFLRDLPPIPPPPALSQRNASLPAQQPESSSLGAHPLKSPKDQVFENEHLMERTKKQLSGRINRLRKKGSRILA